MNPIQKIKRVNEHNILQINIRGDLLDKLIFPMGKPNGLKFPLGNLAILKELRFKENILRCYAEIVIPGLDSTGNLHYEYRLCRITEINFLPLLQISPIKFADFQKFPESLDFYTKATNYYYHKDDFRLRRFAGVSFPQFSKELVEWDKIEANQFQRDRYITGKLAELGLLAIIIGESC